jgi:hypothetical protein
MAYTLEQVKAGIKHQTPFNQGTEGGVYRLGINLVVKVRKGVNHGGFIEKDPLAETKREITHRAINLIMDELPFMPSDWKVRPITIYQSFVDGEQSISIMPCAAGTQLSKLWLFDSHHKVPNLEPGILEYGIVPDHRDNILCDFSIRQITILELIGGIFPEILRKIEKLNPMKRDEVLKDIARIYLLGGVCSYPTIQVHNLSGFADERFSWVLGRRVFELDQTLNRDTSLYDQGHELDWRNDVGMTKEELARVRTIFGDQFVPVPFDWNEGKNLENYGIDPGIFHRFRLNVDGLKPEIDELKKQIVE